MAAYRNIIALVSALGLTHLALGGLWIAVPLALREHGALVVGVVAACYGGGFVAGAYFAPRIVHAIGHIRAFAFCAAIACVTSLLLVFSWPPAVWALMRILTGAAVAGLFTAGESWIATASHGHRRGQLIGAYYVTATLGLIIGPFLFPQQSPELGGFLVAGIAFALALTPIVLTKKAPPAPPAEPPMGPLHIARIAPSAVAGAFVSGLVNTAVLSLSALYVAQRVSAGDAAPDNLVTPAAAFNAAYFIGAIVAAFPLGIASDRVDRRFVVGFAAGMAAFAALALSIIPLSVSMLFPLGLAVAAIWGAGAFNIFAVSIAQAADRAPRDQMIAVSGGLLMIWAAGAVLGPLIGGLALAALPQALFWFAALAHASLALLMFRYRARHAPTPAENKVLFAPVLARSLAHAHLDPRSPGEDDGHVDAFARGREASQPRALDAAVKAASGVGERAASLVRGARAAAQSLKDTAARRRQAGEDDETEAPASAPRETDALPGEAAAPADDPPPDKDGPKSSS